MLIVSLENNCGKIGDLLLELKTVSDELGIVVRTGYQGKCIEVCPNSTYRELINKYCSVT